MRLAIFFASLCFLLLQGNHAACIGKQHNNICHARAILPEKQQIVKLALTHPHISIIDDADLDTEQEYFIRTDADEEDSNDVFSRKFRLLARYYSELTGSSLFHYHHHYGNAAPSAFSQASSKYIRLRVLKI